MTLKVIQGLVGSAPRQPSVTDSPTNNSNNAQTPVATQATTAVLTASSDAVVNAVRTVTRSSSGAEKRLSADEAKSLASDVAKRVRDSEGKGDFDPHSGLDSVGASTSAREHLYS